MSIPKLSKLSKFSKFSILPKLPNSSNPPPIQFIDRRLQIQRSTKECRRWVVLSVRPIDGILVSGSRCLPYLDKLKTLELNCKVTHQLSLPNDLNTTCDLVTTIVNVLQSCSDNVHVVVSV